MTGNGCTRSYISMDCPRIFILSILRLLRNFVLLLLIILKQLCSLFCFSVVMSRIKATFLVFFFLLNCMYLSSNLLVTTKHAIFDTHNYSGRPLLENLSLNVTI